MKSFLFIILLIPHLTMANFTQLEKVKVSNAFLPVFVFPMLNHMSKYHPPGRSYQQVEELLSKINSNLESSPSAHVKSFFMTQMFKSFFEPKNYSDLKSISTQVSTSILKSFEEKTKKNKLLFSEFTQFFLLEILLSYKPYTDDNFLNTYTNTNLNPENRERKRKLMILNGHQGPWISKFLQVSPDEFSVYLSDYIFNYFQDLAEYSKIIKLNTQGELQTSKIFLLPEKIEESFENIKKLIN